MQQLIILLVVVFIGYRVMRRVRGNFSWSELKPGRLTSRIVLLAAIGIFFLSQSGLSAASVVSDIAGILIGAALGGIGAFMTAFDRRGTALFFKGNPWIGSLVTVLFVGRLAYRLYEMFAAPHDGGNWSAGYPTGGSSWTSGLMLIMFAYYVVYYTLLLKQTKRAPARS